MFHFKEKEKFHRERERLQRRIYDLHELNDDWQVRYENLMRKNKEFENKTQSLINVQSQFNEVSAKYQNETKTLKNVTTNFEKCQNDFARLRKVLESYSEKPFETKDCDLSDIFNIVYNTVKKTFKKNK